MEKPEQDIQIEKEYYQNGQLASETPYVGNKICGIIRRWHENGILMSEMPMVDSVPHGMARGWNSAGKLTSECNYTHGSGIFRTWYDDGKPKGEIGMKSESRHGRQRCWDEEGELMTEQFYILGRPVSKKKYREACKQDPSLPTYDFDEPVHAWGDDYQETPLESHIMTADEYKDACDALEWLEGSTDDIIRTLGELPSAEVSIEFVEDFITNGATRVLVVNIDTYDDGSQNTGQILVELPNKAAKRKTALKFCNKQNNLTGFSPVKDTGQRFIHIRLD